MASGFYNRGKKMLVTNGWAGGTIRAMLVGAAYTFDATHNVVSDVSASELAGTTRQTLASRSVTENDVSNRIELMSSDVAFGAIASGTAGGMILYYQTGGSDASPADDDLILFADFADTVMNGATFTVTCPATGWGTQT